MDLNTAIRKIQKCLALSKSPNEGEASNALRQAQALMKQFNVEAGTVGQVAVEMHTALSTACTKPPQWEAAMAVICADAFGCKVFIQRGWFDVCGNGSFMAKYCFIGPKAQAMTAAWTMDLMRTTIAKCRTAYVKETDATGLKEKMAIGNTYAEGFVMGVRGKVAAFAGNDPETEKAMTRMLESKGITASSPASKTTKRAGGSYRDQRAGVARGAEQSLHRPIGG